MKENTKYHNYRFSGKINVDEIQPWFNFATSKPWDDQDIPWILDNKVRREILIKLTEGPKSFQEIYENINFSPIPLLISKEEYECKVFYQWTEETIENHLMNLVWYKLIKPKDNQFELAIPIFSMEKSAEIEKYIVIFAENWINIIRQIKNEVDDNLRDTMFKTPMIEILIEKAVEKLYEILKKENLLPDEPNLKALWAEQLRKIKFKDWLAENF
ncbi:MAG: hypothetical protein ACFFA6_09680 [Promethearchaeota archaeon]